MFLWVTVSAILQNQNYINQQGEITFAVPYKLIAL